MMLRFVLCLTALTAVSSGGDLADRALDAMKRATRFFTEKVSCRGGYLWRYSADLKERFGEGRATAEQVWVQPPGTPAVGMALLRAYEATGQRQFLEAALATARALVWGQLHSGGWDYYIDFGRPPRRPLAYRHLPREAAARLRNHSTLDDNTTQSALSFLMAVDRVAADPAIHEAVEFALEALSKAQLPKGGWPQVFGQPPPEQRYATYVKIEPDGTRTTHERPTRYWHYYTFNDGAINDCVRVMLEAWRQYRQKRYLEAALRAGDFILLSQLPVPQRGWAQQYDLAVRPEWARRFEPPAVCSTVTARNIRTLVEIYLATGQERYLKPIPAAIEWLERSRLPGDRPRWARFYEIGSNRPLYFTRKYELTYEPNDLPTHYAFIIASDLAGRSRTLYERVKRADRRTLLAERQRRPSGPQAARLMRDLAPRVAAIIAALDAQGRWVEDGWIECRTFIRNLATLADYLEATRPAGGQ